MLLTELKQRLENNNEVKIKLYTLDYTIRKEDDGIIIYADLYSSQKKKFNDIDDLLNNYYVYNESMINCLKDVVILDK